MSRQSKIFLRRISVRRCEQSEVTGVIKIESQGPSLLRTVGLQRTVKQFLGDTRHEPISRISATTRELRRILSLFESVREHLSVESGAGG